MKLSLSILAAMVWLGMAHLKAAVFVADFTNDPSYLLNQTVVGQNGWIKRDIPGDDTDAAIILDGDNRKMLRLYSSLADSGKARATVGVNFAPETFTGPLLRAKVSMAWTGVPTSGIAGVAFGRSTSNVPALVSFDDTIGGGIYVQYGEGTHAGGTTKRELLLSTSEVKLGYLYEFDFTFNLEAKTLELTLSGLNAKDEAISITVSDLDFSDLSSLSEINGITVAVSRGERREVWVSSIELAAIPEPSSVALAAIGVAALAWSVRTRHRRSKDDGQSAPFSK